MHTTTLPATPRLWDISPPVDASSPVYPGDSPYRQHWDAQIGQRGSVVNVGCVSASTHLGAHADAPLHYALDGAAVGALALEPFIGPCRVVHAIGVGPVVQWAHVAAALQGGAGPLPPRVLVRTCQRMPAQHWNDALVALAPELLHRLWPMPGCAWWAPTAPASTPPTAPRCPATKWPASATCACWRTCTWTTYPPATTN